MSQDSPFLPSQRKTVITANWKMYKNIEEALTFVETLAPLVADSQVQVCLAVPFTAIFPVSERIQELKLPFIVGAQNMNDAQEGAFTGEIAGRMLKEAGAEFVILGHSERRHIFHEDNALINQKVKRALSDELVPLLCVGETLEERERGDAEKVIRQQMIEGLEGISVDRAWQIMLAYEPVWAIGTGKVASASDASQIHHFCREVFGQLFGKEVADHLIIQYGGSVKPENAHSLLNQGDIDGLLVGGASLSAQSFSQIINSV